MIRGIIPRTEYEVYFFRIDKARPGKAAVRQYLRAHHPLYSNDFPVSRSSCTIAGKRFEMITVFARRRTLTERIFAKRKITQTQALVDRFASEKHCVVRAPDELLVLNENPDSVNFQNVHEDTKHGPPADCTITEIDNILSAERTLPSRGAMILAIAILIPVAFAIACATITQDRQQELKQKAQSETTRSSPAATTTETIPSAHDFFTCLNADLDAANASGGRILSYHYDGGPTEKISIKVAGGKIATLGETLGKRGDVAGLTIPGISFGNGYSEYTVAYSRANGTEKRTASFTWQTLRNLEANWTDSDIKPERVKLVPQLECSFLIEPSDLPECIGSLANWCKRESLDVKALSIDAGAQTSVMVVFAEKNGNITTGKTDRKAIKKAFGLTEAIAASQQTTNSNAVVGKISEGDKTNVTFRKDESGKIRQEGGIR